MTRSMISSPESTNFRTRKYWWLGCIVFLFSTQTGLSQEVESIIDTHVHFLFQPVSPCDFTASLQRAMDNMTTSKIKFSLMMPQPATKMGGCDYTKYVDAIGGYSNQFAVLGGGALLNPLIQKALEEGTVSSLLEQQFIQYAEDIRAGGAVGYGELAAEHFSLFDWHPYESAPPNHDLFLLLASISAQNGLPIDLHMEAIENATAPHVNSLAYGNDKNLLPLQENISALEELLSQEPPATIVWAHAGWDNTGDRTVELMSRLLGKYSNLVMQIRLSPPTNGLPNNPLQAAPDGKGWDVKQEWIDMIQLYPDQFVYGSDWFYEEEVTTFSSLTELFFQKLPEDIRDKVAYENAMRIYQVQASHVKTWEYK